MYFAILEYYPVRNGKFIFATKTGKCLNFAYINIREIKILANYQLVGRT